MDILIKSGANTNRMKKTLIRILAWPVFWHDKYFEEKDGSFGQYFFMKYGQIKCFLICILWGILLSLTGKVVVRNTLLFNQSTVAMILLGMLYGIVLFIVGVVQSNNSKK